MERSKIMIDSFIITNGSSKTKQLISTGIPVYFFEIRLAQLRPGKNSFSILSINFQNEKARTIHR